MNMPTIDRSMIRVQTPNSPDAKRAEALDIANQFEQVFVKQMVEAFRKTNIDDGEGMFGSGPGSDTYADWFDQHMSEHLVQSRGIGVADVILRDLKRFGQLPTDATKTTTPGVDHVA